MWAGRCLRRGWFLPFAPAPKEFGAWKSHYAACLGRLDWLTPREAQSTYGTLNQASAGPGQEAEERSRERRIREALREALREERSEWLPSAGTPEELRRRGRDQPSALALALA